MAIETYTSNVAKHIMESVPLPKVSEKQGTLPVVALDPGVCIFHTTYSSTGEDIHWDEQDFRHVDTVVHSMRNSEAGSRSFARVVKYIWTGM